MELWFKKRVQVSLKKRFTSTSGCVVCTRGKSLSCRYLHRERWKDSKCKEHNGDYELSNWNWKHDNNYNRRFRCRRGFRSISCICTIRSYRVYAIAFFVLLFVRISGEGYLVGLSLSEIVGKSICCVEPLIY